MGFFPTLLNSWRKSKRLQTISRVLGGVKVIRPPLVQDLEKMSARQKLFFLTIDARRENAKQELFNLIEDDPLLAELMERHGGSRATLERAYQCSA